MPNSHAFRKVMGCFATGITVVTVEDPKLGPAGITINSFTSVSLKPPLVLFCLDRSAHVYPMFKKAKRFAVNILGAEQEELSRHFADRHHHKKAAPLWDKPQQGCPILRGVLGWMVCDVTATFKGGDHTIFLGKPIALKKRGAREPLLYFHGRYRKIGD
jgi:3-hydroxy-9,10-secoandrosta-1,3,5(10)-triene-9,17-dione monooxygenase reductase component